MTTTEYNDCVNNYADDLFRYAMKLVSNDALGQDVTQEVFERIWIKRDEIRSEEAKNYLFRAVYNSCMDHLRKHKVQRQYVDHVKATGDVHYSEHRFELQDYLSSALQKLPESQRSLILLRDYEGYSYKEIGEITGLTESKVKVYIFRGRKALKSIIQAVNQNG